MKPVASFAVAANVGPRDGSMSLRPGAWRRRADDLLSGIGALDSAFGWLSVR